MHIHTDGGARGNPGQAACAFVVTDEKGRLIHRQGFYLGVTTNNQAEYLGVIKALEWLSAQKHEETEFFLDSQLIVNQLNGRYRVKDSGLKIKNLEIKDLIKNFKLKIKNFSYVPRTQNSQADLLVNQTLDRRTR